MLRAIRQRVHAPAGRLVLLVLALLLWPGSAFAAMDCCPPDASGLIETSAHPSHDVAAGVSTHQHGEAADPPCHGDSGMVPAVADSAACSDCDSGCVARCATPNLFTLPSSWPVVIESAFTVVRWSERVAPSPETSQLLRPPITA
jgi:hypothetical protein